VLTQTQLAAAVAEHANLSRADAKHALAALEEIVRDELGNAERVKIGGLVQLTVRVKSGAEIAQGAQPRDRRGDPDRREESPAWMSSPGC
jgi:nucleoid DNA-binding protein